MIREAYGDIDTYVQSFENRESVDRLMEHLATFEATKKWTSTIRNWGAVYGELSIMYEGRLPE